MYNQIMGHQSPAIRTDSGGVIRVGKTRVTLDTVIGAYSEGVSVEEIVDRYPSLGLAEVHAAIAYYLANRTKIERYLAARRQCAEEVRCEAEALCGSGLRDRLRERRARKA